MPTVDFSNLSQDADTPDLEFDTFLSSSSTFYNYETVGGHQVILLGTGITVNGSNQPIGGTITSVLIDFGNNDPAQADVTITGLNINILEIATLNTGDTPLWELMLAGDTTVIGSDNFSYSLGGDLDQGLDQLVRYGGNDTFDTGDFGSVFVSGDALVIEQGMLISGDDEITGIAGYLVGDVYTVQNGGRVIGGDDIITIESDPDASGQIIISGDVTTLQSGSTLFGGNDILDASSFTSSQSFNWFMTGDALQMYNDGSYLVGGDDILYAPVFGGILYGDVRSIAFDNPHFEGGNDTLYGGDGNDFLFGDTSSSYVSTEAYYTGGDDLAYGGGGSDLIYGGGGNDGLYGGAGKDTMYGELQSDLLFGGGGNDYLSGGEGKDTLNGGKGNDGILGSNGKDKLSGGSGNDFLDGGASDDIVFGGAGKDELFGGAGDDTITGGGKADEFVFTQGADKDTITDFKNNTDTIALDTRLWTGDLSVQEIIDDFGQIKNGNALFKFGDGDVLKIEGVTNLNQLSNDIEIFSI